MLAAGSLQLLLVGVRGLVGALQYQVRLRAAPGRTPEIGAGYGRVLALGDPARLEDVLEAMGGVSG